MPAAPASASASAPNLGFLSGTARGGSAAGLARALIQHNVLATDLVTSIQTRADQAKVRFLDELIASGAMSPLQIAQFAAEKFGHPLVDLYKVNVNSLPLDAIDRKLVTEARAVPLAKQGNRLSIAISDPTDFATLDRIKFATGCQLDPVVVEHDKLQKLIAQVGQTSTQQLADLVGAVPDTPQEEMNATALLEMTAEVEDAPAVRVLQKVLLDAIQAGASDLHFEPYERFYRIRFRIDGQLREVAQPPLSIREKLASRIKVISKLDISEKRLPQDGRMKLSIPGNRTIDFRVSTLPTQFGEKLVLRILDPSTVRLGVDALGYEPEQKAALLEAISRPYGMVLVTGPTGSGKAVSLYTCLNLLNRPGVNLSTAEDPVEIHLPGINQVSVNDKAGLTFASALRAFLRQDPDVIMVGEIRDSETAEIAVKAAQTGHLVLSTLHTNDAPASLTRLVHMGVPAFHVASSVLVITAQRLARRLCECKEPWPVAASALRAAGFEDSALDESWHPFRPVGCELCNGSGYRGRVGIHQVMPVSDAMQRVILKGGNDLEIAEQAARDGVRTLRQAGLRKVQEGITGIEEVLAVTNQ